MKNLEQRCNDDDDGTTASYDGKDDAADNADDYGEYIGGRGGGGLDLGQGWLVGCWWMFCCSV